jgi:hypothetical protein
MSECGPIRRRYAASKERQMLVGAYTPVIVFALLLVIAEIARIRQHQREAAVS